MSSPKRSPFLSGPKCKCRRLRTRNLRSTRTGWHLLSRHGNLRITKTIMDPTPPVLSVVILNFNGRSWLPRCIDSLAAQTFIGQAEVIVADNASTDGSDELATTRLADLNLKGHLVQNGGNLGYCEGNNRGAATAKGKYLLFLNTDTWLENDCLERLIEASEAASADCASPMVLNYDDDSFQGNGASGFDLFGYLTSPRHPLPCGSIFAAPGCCLLVRKDVFEKVGGFDSEFFMYADEADLAWRLNLSGARTITVSDARVHHRGAAAANPKGGGKVVEFRTNEMVRFFATRNSFLLLLKNTEHVLLFVFFTQCIWVVLEMLALLLLTRRWSIVRNGYLRAFSDLWAKRTYIKKARKENRLIRKHGDWWMLRFLRLRPGRVADVQRLFRLGIPRINPP
jgi:N-acetylglucosaminyl-diphospho-decaprenol L-rhamnosyltransferase